MPPSSSCIRLCTSCRRRSTWWSWTRGSGPNARSCTSSRICTLPIPPRSSSSGSSRPEPRAYRSSCCSHSGPGQDHPSRDRCGRTSASLSSSPSPMRKRRGSSTQLSTGSPTSSATRSSRVPVATRSSSRSPSARSWIRALSRRMRRANGSCASGPPRSRCRQRSTGSSPRVSIGCHRAPRKRSSSPR